jgi:hypothetical protein
MHDFLGGAEMAHDRFGASCMQIPGLLVDFRFVDGHSHTLPKVFRPCGKLIFHAKHSRVIQAFVEPAPERAVAPARRLDFLHENSKLLPILAVDQVINVYCNRSLIVVRNDGQFVRIIQRGFLDLDFRGKVN